MTRNVPLYSSLQNVSVKVSYIHGLSVHNETRELLAGVLEGSRAHLARAITLIETKHPGKHQQAQWLLTSLLSHRNKLKKSNKLRDTFRIGFSGSPGAGKSTLIETLGKSLTGLDHRVAVLAVDPSSSRTGGSILGDKTRMPKLSSDPNAFIRPSPSGGTLGGVTRNTQEAILLCEGAGYDVIIVETVGVGQSETVVADMVDMFVLLVPPAAGDELQGLKKGIVELADLVLVTKADGDLLPAARRIQTEYSSALRLVRRALNYPWKPRVLRVSSFTNEGVNEAWETMTEYKETLLEKDLFNEKRMLQQKTWLWYHIQWQLMERFHSDPVVNDHLKDQEESVMAGRLTPGTAADNLIKFFIKQ
uniref:AAA+ ATPase domain-containing protein n=1 Tax=Amphimedon queenslandica TaxID=400682 RepID=A0A1X7V1D0_AMPQE